MCRGGGGRVSRDKSSEVPNTLCSLKNPPPPPMPNKVIDTRHNITPPKIPAIKKKRERKVTPSLF